MKKTIQYKIGAHIVNITIQKKKKKNISLVIRGKDKIEINIPYKLSYNKALGILKTKEKWVLEKLDKYTLLYEEKRNEDGKVYYYLGKKHSLAELQKIAIKSEYIKNDNCEFSLDSWYLYELKNILEKKVETYSLKMKLYPKKIKIKYLKSAWGICYSTGTVTFNLNLIKVPMEIIDYLVVHELGHLKHPNHSKEFWDFIGLYIDTPKTYKKWLRNEGYKFNN